MPPVPDPSTSSASASRGNRRSRQSSSRTSHRETVVVPDMAPSSSRAASNTTTTGDGMIHIVVKVVSGQSNENISLQLPSTASVGDLKLAIADEKELPPERQRLIFYGRMLQDDSQKLTNLNMKADGSVNYVHLCPKPAGTTSTTARAPARVPASGIRGFFTDSSSAATRRAELEHDLAMARRLGQARRRRNHPYPTAATSSSNNQPSAALRELMAHLRGLRDTASDDDEEERVMPHEVPSSSANDNAQAPTASDPQQQQQPSLTDALMNLLFSQSSQQQPPYPVAGAVPIMSLPVPIMVPSLMMPPPGLAGAFPYALPPETPTFPRENQVLVASLASRFMEGITESGIQLQNLVCAGISRADPDAYEDDVERTIVTLDNLSSDASSLARRFRQILDNPDSSPEARAAAMREASDTVAETAQALQATLHHTFGALQQAATPATPPLAGQYENFAAAPPIYPTIPNAVPSFGVPVATMSAPPFHVPSAGSMAISGPISISMVGGSLPPGTAFVPQAGSQPYMYGPDPGQPHGWH